MIQQSHYLVCTGGDAESIEEEEDKVRQGDDAINRKGKVWRSMAQEGQI